MTELVTRLQLLERAVAGLIATNRGGGRSEALVPNYLTISNGLTGASFTGQVHAQGLNLDAGTVATPPTVDRVRWLRTSDGARVAELFSYETTGAGGTDVLVLQATPTAGAQRGQVSVVAATPTTTQNAGLLLQRAADGEADSGTRALVVVTNAAGVQQPAAILMAADGTSSFIGTAGLAAKQLSLDAGSVNVNFPNSQTATPLVVNHGLGRIPIAVELTVGGGALSQNFTFDSGSETAMQFTINGWTNVVTNFSVAVRWVVVG